jgi:hypothetical protein
MYTFSLLPGDGLRPVEAWALFHKPATPPLVATNQFILFRQGGKVHLYVDALSNQM